MTRHDDPGMDQIWRALEMVGRLTANQAARLTGWTPQAAGLRLRRLVDAGTVVSFQQAYWHPRCPRRGSRHRALVAEMYVRLAPLAPLWTFETAREGPYRPDGWLIATEGPASRRVALEADRATERESAWQAKLTRYRDGDSAGLIVAVPDERRATRVRSWVAQAGVTALVVPVATLSADGARPYLNALDHGGPADTPPLTEPPARTTSFILEGRPVDGAVFARVTARGDYAVSIERLAGHDLWHGVRVGRPLRSRIAGGFRGRGQGDR